MWDTTLVSTSSWADYLGKSSDDSEKAKLRQARQPIRDIGYNSTLTDVIIAEYLESGYVDWSCHTSLLQEAEKRYQVSKLGDELSNIWSIFWGNFTVPQHSFVSQLRTFILKHWAELRLRDVDESVRFLCDLDPQVDLFDVLEKRILLFVEKHCDGKSLSPEFHNVHRDTIKRINELLVLHAPQIPIDSAFERMTKEGGWTPSDVKFLTNTTVDQFYEFLTASERPYFLAGIKELRSRLASENKTVLGRLDEALRRLAKRSKLDEARVRQTDLDLSKGNDAEDVVSLNESQ